MIKTHNLRLRKQATTSTKQTLKIWDTSVKIPPSTCNWLYRLPGKTATWIWNICKWKVQMCGQQTCKTKTTDLTIKLLVTDKYSVEGTVSFLRQTGHHHHVLCLKPWPNRVPSYCSLKTYNSVLRCLAFTLIKLKFAHKWTQVFTAWPPNASDNWWSDHVLQGQFFICEHIFSIRNYADRVSPAKGKPTASLQIHASASLS